MRAGGPDDAGGGKPKIGVVVVAYNAEHTLAQVLSRIPTEFRSRIAEVLVCDDHSADATYLVGLGMRATMPDLPLTVVRNRRNLGYGGNQKAAYRMAIEHGLDIVVLLHGDGQYAPELLPSMVEPLERGEADAVFGSRMLEAGAARRGGMPLYKLLGNRILTAFENRMLDMELSEFHSGYRAYRTDVLAALGIERNSDGFDFDTQIIVQLHAAGKRIVEIPIPTYYGDEICYVNGIAYARDVAAEVLRYRLGELGFGQGARCLPVEPAPYALKQDAHSSHGQILGWLADLPPGLVLDLGCAHGAFAELVGKLGHRVVGVDVEEHEGVERRLERFVCADLAAGIPDEVGDGFDVVLAADVLEHLPHPELLVRQALSRLRPGGLLIVCVPNFGHLYPRLRTALGRFDYDSRGILDRTHLRFFTKASFERLLSSEGCTIVRRSVTGLPVDVLGASEGRVWRLLGALDRAAAALRPQIFGYQLLYALTRAEDAAGSLDAAAEPA